MTRHRHRPPQSHRLATGLSRSSLLLVLWLAVSQAQVRTTLTADGTLGTTVTSNGTLYTITGGTRPGNGPNLFHSFDRFSVGTNETARFSGPTGIVNILSRVTGGQESMIDGRLQSTIPGANLYLLNPSGMLFGPNAKLDLSGSFHVSTADFLRFSDGATFSAHVGQNSTLTTAPPAAFGFLGPTPAPITVNGSALQVSPEKTLAVVGGEVRIAGASNAAPSLTLNAPGGRIHLVSVASEGEVSVALPGPVLDVESGTMPRGGRLELSAAAGVGVRAPETQDQDAGDIVVRAGTLRLTEAAQLNAVSNFAGPAGRITVVARDVLLTEGGAMTVSTNTKGPGGEIRIQTETLRLTGQAQISSSSAGKGPGGRITVQASERVEMVGEGPDRLHLATDIDSNTSGRGDGGHVVITAPTVSLENGHIRAGTGGGSTGHGGVIEVRGDTVTLGGGSDISTDTSGTGPAGRVTVVATKAISMRGGSTMSSPTSGRGDGGQVFVAAPVVSLEGAGSAIGASTSGPGQAGAIELQAGTLRLTGGAEISNTSFGEGRAGSITVTAQTLTMTDGRLTAETFGAGAAGDLTLNVASLVAQGATLTSSSTGAATGKAGTVRIQGPGGLGTPATQVMLTGSTVGTEAAVADGGDIEVRAQHMLRLRDSQITTAVRSGQGRGGDIRIDPDAVILERSQIVANAFRGPGGNIRIVAQAFVMDTLSQVSASSAKNVAGIVDIQAVTTPSGLVAPVPLAFASAAALLRSPCAAPLHEGTVSTLVARGHDGVPTTPDGVLPSRLPLAPLDTATPSHAGGLPSTARVWPLGESPRDPSGPLALRGWAAAVDALRLLPGDCASR